MIALADCDPTNYLGDAAGIWFFTDGLFIRPDPSMDGVRPPVFRHNGGADGVFCDAHVEFGQSNLWVDTTDAVRSRWNNDNQPHPKTWIAW